MRLDKYLERIGYRGAVRPTLATLDALQRAHVCSVPFENLDVQLARPVSIDPGAAFDKIVGNGRGGWCYEQNGLFGWALAEIGFDVTRMAAAVMRAERGEASTANHLCLKVRCEDSDADYLTDVGFGGSMLAPIRLEEAEHRQRPFRIGLRRLDDRYWQFWEDNGGGEFRYDFRAEPADEAALAYRSEFLQTDPSSGFVLNLVAQLRNAEQHRALRGRVLSIATSAGIDARLLESADELVNTLADQFRLHVPGIAELWPRIVARHETVFKSAKA